jgi:hypothetical protein
MKKTTYHGIFNYVYDYSNNDKEEIQCFFDKKILTTECKFEFINIDLFLIHVKIKTPDASYCEEIENNIKKMELHGGENLEIGINFKNYKIENELIIINGLFILEIKNNDENFHVFNFSIETINKKLLVKILENNLFNI